jgi:hypothetical protein
MNIIFCALLRIWKSIVDVVNRIFFKNWRTLLLSVQKVVCLWSPYGWTFVEVSTVRCFFGYIGDNPVRVCIGNRTGENTQKVSFGCTPARGLNKVILKFAMARVVSRCQRRQRKVNSQSNGYWWHERIPGGSDCSLWSFQTSSCLQVWVFGFMGICCEK